MYKKKKFHKNWHNFKRLFHWNIINKVWRSEINAKIQQKSITIICQIWFWRPQPKISLQRLNYYCQNRNPFSFYWLLSNVLKSLTLTKNPIKIFERSQIKIFEKTCIRSFRKKWCSQLHLTLHPFQSKKVGFFNMTLYKISSVVQVYVV
jgi:hypothetical protein